MSLAWFFAASPISRWLPSANATYDGVIRLPWSFAQISTRPPCHTPTQLYVVPWSIPMHGPSISPPSFDSPPLSPLPPPRSRSEHRTPRETAAADADDGSATSAARNDADDG